MFTKFETMKYRDGNVDGRAIRSELFSTLPAPQVRGLRLKFGSGRVCTAAVIQRSFRSHYIHSDLAPLMLTGRKQCFSALQLMFWASRYARRIFQTRQMLLLLRGFRSFSCCLAFSIPSIFLHSFLVYLLPTLFGFLQISSGFCFSFLVSVAVSVHPLSLLSPTVAVACRHWEANPSILQLAPSGTIARSTQRRPDRALYLSLPLPLHRQYGSG